MQKFKFENKYDNGKGKVKRMNKRFTRKDRNSYN